MLCICDARTLCLLFQFMEQNSANHEKHIVFVLEVSYIHILCKSNMVSKVILLSQASLPPYSQCFDTQPVMEPHSAFSGRLCCFLVYHLEFTEGTAICIIRVYRVGLQWLPEESRIERNELSVHWGARGSRQESEAWSSLQSLM